MKIAVLGSGYVGLCTAVGFAHLGHNVTCIDIDKQKVEKINAGKAPIYEKNLDGMLSDALNKKLLHATDDISSVKDIDFIFIAVGTPSKDNGSIDLNYIEKASHTVSDILSDKEYCVIVVKSTVLPETTDKVIIPILERYGKKAGKDFGVCVNPEFLREGRAIEDFLNPDRIIIGEFDKKSGDVLENLYNDFDSVIKRTTLRTAELIKYASNAFLATKISFINEIGNMCKDLGIDIYDVAEGMGLDKRISPHFLQAGIGFGGSCFRKDLEALRFKTKETGHKSKILDAVLDTNKEQPIQIISLLKNRCGNLKGKTIALLGLAFKEDTDDVRDAPSIKIISELLNENCIINCYDPKASENMKKIFPKINYFDSSATALKNSDACLILTEWNEFKKMKNEDFNVMKNKVIIEGRKVLNKDIDGFEGVCW